MAEGGNQPSIQDGSDADIGFTCTPCIEEGSREEAIKYCQQCDEYLCKTCMKCHLKMKATRDHKLVDREEGKLESNITTRTTKTKCLQHPDRDIEMYCGTHDMVYCSMCIATEHRPCSGVTSLADAASSNFQQTKNEHMLKEVESIKELLKDAENEKQNNIVSVEEERNEIQGKIQEIENGTIRHIKALSKQAKDKLDETYSVIKGELESEIAVLGSNRSEVEKVQGKMHSTTESNKEQQFVQVKFIQHILNHAKTIYEKFEAGGQVSVDFVEETDISQRFFEVKAFGKIEITRVKRNMKIKYQKEVKVRMQSDQSICRIIDACQLESGVFVLADLNNRKVKLLDTKHKVIGNFDLQSETTGVCRTVGQFWVSTGQKVDVYGTNGSPEKSVENNAMGKKIFNSQLRQMTAYKNLVVVADSSNGVVCLWNDGTKKAEFRDSRLTKTVGVCISCDDTVYAIDELSSKIVVFSMDGKYVGEMVPENPSGKVPESLCYDNKNNCILIGYRSSDTITVLYLSS